MCLVTIKACDITENSNSEILLKRQGYPCVHVCIYQSGTSQIMTQTGQKSHLSKRYSDSICSVTHIECVHGWVGVPPEVANASCVVFALSFCCVCCLSKDEIKS